MNEEYSSDASDASQNPSEPSTPAGDTYQYGSGQEAEPSYDAPLTENRHDILSTFDQQEERRSPGKLIGIITAIVVGLAAIGVGGYFAYGYFYLTPERILASVVERADSIKTYEYNGEIRAVVTGLDELSLLALGGLEDAEEAQEGAEKEKESKSKTFLVRSAGVVDATDREKPKFTMNMNFAEDQSAKQPELRSEGETSLNVLLGIEFRLVENVAYASAKQLPSFGFFDLSVLENIWIRLGDLDDLDKEAEKLGEGELDSRIEGLPEEKEKQIRELFLKERYYALSRGNEKLSGVSTHHLVFELYQEGVLKYFERIKQILSEEELKPDERQAIEKFIKEYMPADKPIRVELWVGKRDYYPYQYKVSFIVPKTEEFPVTADISLRQTNSKFNTPVTIDAPEGAKSIEEVMGSLFGGGLSIGGSDEIPEMDEVTNAPKNEYSCDEYAERTRDTDSDVLPDWMESELGTQLNKKDSDGDGYTDFEELENGYNPLGSGKADTALFERYRVLRELREEEMKKNEYCFITGNHR